MGQGSILNTYFFLQMLNVTLTYQCHMLKNTTVAFQYSQLNASCSKSKSFQRRWVFVYILRSSQRESISQNALWASLGIIVLID